MRYHNAKLLKQTLLPTTFIVQMLKTSFCTKPKKQTFANINYDYFQGELRNTFGSPPIPKATSREKEPVDTTGTSLGVADRPSHMIDPFPNEEVI